MLPLAATTAALPGSESHGANHQRPEAPLPRHANQDIQRLAQNPDQGISVPETDDPPVEAASAARDGTAARIRSHVPAQTRQPGRRKPSGALRREDFVFRESSPS